MTRYVDLATLRKHISPDVAIVNDARPTIAPAELAALGYAGDLGAPAEMVLSDAGLVAQSIVLPLPPSANVYWRYTSTGVYVSEAAENYKATVKLRALLQRMAPFAGEVAMYVHVYRQRKAGDLDNFAKVLGDSLNGVAYHDDSQVVELHMWRHDDKANPRVEVGIRRIA